MTLRQYYLVFTQYKIFGSAAKVFVSAIYIKPCKWQLSNFSWSQKLYTIASKFAKWRMSLQTILYSFHSKWHTKESLKDRSGSHISYTSHCKYKTVYHRLQGTAFFYVLNPSFFCVLLKNAMFFYVLFSSFWQLMRRRFFWVLFLRM